MINKRHKDWRTPLAPVLRQRARAMRTEPAEAEAKLWKLVRNRRFAGYRCRRQVPMGRHIVDFYCASAHLVIDLDGSQHADNPRDAVRNARLKAEGFPVLRIWNNQLLTDPDAVANAIWHHTTGGPLQ